MPGGPKSARCLIGLVLALSAALLAAGAVSAAEQKPWYENLSPEWGGHIRLQGVASWPPTQSYYGPVGTDEYNDGYSDFRLKNKIYFGNWGYFVTHYEASAQGGDTRRKNSALQKMYPQLFASGIMPGAPINDDRRLFDLTKTISSDNDYIIYHRLDRLFLGWQPDWGSVRIGRQALTWGNGMLFNPMDLFNPFSPTDFTRDYKVGDDMVFTQISTDNTGWQFLYVPRRDPATRDIMWEDSSVAGKLHLVKGTTEFDLMAAKHYKDYVTVLGATGYLGDAAWRLNATWTFMQGDYRDKEGYLSLVANVDYSWVWWGKNCYGWIEFYFNGLGKDDYEAALADPNITERVARGELFTLGRTYLDVELKIELHPLFTVYCTVINNLHDPSGILQPRGVWSVTQNTEILFGANIGYGAEGTEYGGVRIPGTTLHNTPSPNAYLRYTYYF